MPSAIPPTRATVFLPARPYACLLHADVHVMRSDCWSAVDEWVAANDHYDEDEVRDAYQAAVERKMLDDFMRTHRPGAAPESTPARRHADTSPAVA